MKSSSVHAKPLDLKAGEWVEVRSQEEILATLDEKGWLEGLPFMPEMLQYCGQKLRVYKRADKTCDTVVPWSIRRMENAVHLETRCDGSGHGGCEAGCLIFWKEAWLKRAEKNTVSSQSMVPFASAHGRNARLVSVGSLLAASQKTNPEGESHLQLPGHRTAQLHFRNEVVGSETIRPRHSLGQLGQRVRGQLQD